MPEVKAEDLEELYTRRMTDQVVERAEQIIHRRYLWISITGGLAFAVITWLGGATLISDFVKARVDDAVIKQSQAIHDTEGRANTAIGEMRPRLEQVDETLQDAKVTEKKLVQQLHDLKEEANSLKDQLEQIVSARNTLQKNTEDIALLKTSVDDLATLNKTEAQFQGLLEELAKESPTMASKVPPAAAQSQALQTTEHLVETNKKLAQPTVFVQFSGAVSGAQIDALRSALQKLDMLVPAAERVPSKVREVRYFYAADKDLSDQVAKAAQTALSESGFGDQIVVKSTPLLNYPKLKPPLGTVELWLGDMPSPRN